MATTTDRREEESVRRTRGGGWPIVAMFAGYPLWWALGLGAFALFLLAIPVVFTVARRRTITLPRGTGLYLVFLVFVAASALMLGTQPPHTRPSSQAGLLLGYLYRSGSYVIGLAVLLYVVNVPERTLSTARLLGALSALFAATVLGGWLGVLFPRLEFTSVFERLLPESLSSNSFVNVQVHPRAAEMQAVLRSLRWRPQAPFEYTNAWGASLTLLLPLFVVGWRSARRRWQRIGGWIILVAAVPPVVLSLNRAVWAVLGFSAIFGIVHLARTRRLRVGTRVSVVVVGTATLAAALALSPLRSVVVERFRQTANTSERMYIYGLVLENARYSPVLGWGTPRRTSGGPNSIAAGASLNCPRCTVLATGTHGTFWTILFSNGVVALGLFLAFLLVRLRRLLAGRTDLEVAAALVVLVFLSEMFVYNQLPTSLAITMAAIGLGWRAARNPPGWRDRSDDEGGQVRPRTMTWETDPSPSSCRAIGRRSNC
jgi:hypothetical protein